MLDRSNGEPAVNDCCLPLFYQVKFPLTKLFEVDGSKR